jgi:hypothetical protein
MLSLSNHGQIERMTLPEGWVESEAQTRSEADLSQLRKFHAPGNEDVQICFHYRGLPVTERSGESFRKLLEMPRHQLMPKEMWDIQEVLDSMMLDNNFETVSARVDDVHGKRVLIVEGRWVPLKFDTYSMFIDASGTGSVVHEIYYAAPVAHYPLHLKEAKNALESIVWKQA